MSFLNETYCRFYLINTDIFQLPFPANNPFSDDPFPSLGLLLRGGGRRIGRPLGHWNLLFRREITYLPGQVLLVTARSSRALQNGFAIPAGCLNQEGVLAQGALQVIRFPPAYENAVLISTRKKDLPFSVCCSWI